MREECVVQVDFRSRDYSFVFVIISLEASVVEAEFCKGKIEFEPINWVSSIPISTSAGIERIPRDKSVVAVIAGLDKKIFERRGLEDRRGNEEIGEVMRR